MKCDETAEERVEIELKDGRVWQGAEEPERQVFSYTVNQERNLDYVWGSYIYFPFDAVRPRRFLMKNTALIRIVTQALKII